ncbi:hypothetical protein DXA09_21160, partial [Absiella sp. AM54-8XD]|uniref:hypothetical protein n=1 Tax=Absiella sp. AM54-8XD TaxID=2292279 RepID=UPI000E9DC7CF
MSSFDIVINILESFLLAFLCYALMTKKDNRSIFCIILFLCYALMTKKDNRSIFCIILLGVF